MAKKVAELPAELPAEAEEGGGRVFRRPRWAELPPFLSATTSLEHEVLRLRNRLSSLEEQLLLSGVFRPGVPWPPELPEGGEGGGGVVRRPGHINELPPFEILATISEQLAQLTQRIDGNEEQIASLRGQ